MRRYICAAIIILTTIIPFAATATHAYHNGYNMSCVAEQGYGNKKSATNWAYYWCGPRDSKCAGNKQKDHDKGFYLFHGDSFTFKYDTSGRLITTKTDNNTYWCCEGTKETKGHFVAGAKWIVNEKTETVPVNGGTCNKLIRTNVCGETYEIECTTPDNCDAGYIMRNGECVKPCEDGQVWNGETSNTCVTCDVTLHQGPAANRESCIKCDEFTEFFNRKTKKCISKTENMLQYYKQAMRQCWRCPRDLFYKCVKADNPTDDLKEACHL